MPRTARSLALTDAYRARILTLRTRVIAAARSSWAAVTLDDFEATYGAWARSAAGTLTTAQLAAAGQADLYVSAYLAAELDDAVAPRGVDGADRAGMAENGLALTDALATGAITVRHALAHAVAAPEALERGRRRAERLLASETVAAGRHVVHELIATDDRITGWRRATSGNACGACLAAATGAIRRDDRALEAHDGCRCAAEPVVRGVRERVRRPTGQDVFDGMSTAEQDALFAGRGGAAKAELIRSGAVELADLRSDIAHQHRPDGIAETPLRDLQRLAA
jgi:hypothetical protein